ncbi:hypothetical protein ACFFR3_45810 [Nonomuraea salmonea]|uniref:Sigma-70 family RNA polymerase sigma factor n=1 Tax=Nonomuraea salmonea TaxID=46181 RepID=A0ABV5P2W4_9ACTN
MTTADNPRTIEHAIRERVRAARDAQLRLMTRYGDEHAQRWASQPDNSPRTSPYTLLGDILSPRAREDAPDPTRQDWSDALRQVGPARRDLDGLETNILIRARAAGLTWREIADALGLDSPQAAQQRARRLGATTDETPDETREV